LHSGRESSHARKFLGLTDAAQASKILRELAISILNEIKDLPTKVTDPNWLESLEDDDGDATPTPTPRGKCRAK
jgi:hypothetical protein